MPSDQMLEELEELEARGEESLKKLNSGTNNQHKALVHGPKWEKKYYFKLCLERLILYFILKMSGILLYFTTHYLLLAAFSVHLQNKQHNNNGASAQKD